MVIFQMLSIFAPIYTKKPALSVGRGGLDMSLTEPFMNKQVMYSQLLFYTGFGYTGIRTYQTENFSPAETVHSMFFTV